MDNNPNGTPPAAEFGQMRSFLARQGYSQQQINEAIGIKPNGRTRAEIARALADWIQGQA